MGPAYWAFAVLMLLNIAFDRWRPGTMAATFIRYAFLSYGPVWFGLKIRSGYRAAGPTGRASRGFATSVWP